MKTIYFFFLFLFGVLTISVPIVLAEDVRSSITGETPQDSRPPSASLVKKSIEVKVNGMVCDFCARGLEKTLKKKEAVKGIHVDLETGTILIDLIEAKELEDSEIEKVIANNGISVVSISRQNEKQ